MFISVIVCTHNRADLLGGCLQSLADQELQEGDYEVVVVENACEDDTNAVLESFVKRSPRFRAVQEPRAGKSRALNAGLSCARGTHVAFIDDDARAPRDWVGRLAAAFSDIVPRPAVVVGKIEPVYERQPPPWWPPEWVDGEPGFLRRVDLFNRVAGSNLAFDRQALLDCGGFALEHGPIGDRFRLGEDTEAVVRVAARYPYVWYDPRIAVRHWVPCDKMTLGYLTRRTFLSGVAVSRIDETRLLSFETIRAAGLSARDLVTRRRNDALVAAAPASALPAHWRGRARVRLARLTLRLAAAAGRIGGARFSTDGRHPSAPPPIAAQSEAGGGEKGNHGVTADAFLRRVAVLAVCPADWLGVRKSISQGADAFSDVRRARDAIREHRPEEVRFGGYDPDWRSILRFARSRGCRIVVTIHHTPAFHEFAPSARTAIAAAVRDFKAGLIDRFETPHEGVARTLSMLGAPCEHRRNTTVALAAEPRTHTRPGPHIGIFGSGMPWKNMDAQMLAAALVVRDRPGGAIHVQHVADPSLLKALGVEYEIHPRMDQVGFSALLASMTVNLAANFTETFGYLAVESFLLGVPCLFSPMTPAFFDVDERSPLWRCRVERIDDSAFIADRIGAVLENRDEIVAAGMTFCQRHVVAATGPRR